MAGRFAPSVQLQINGVWTDVTSRVRGAIDVEYGIKASGGKIADPASCSMTLENNDGALSIRNPLSPYYPWLGVNTPIRVGQAVIGAAPWLDMPNGSTGRASTPDAAVLDITGDLDLRADIECAVWGDAVDSNLGAQEIMGKSTAVGSQKSWLFLVTSDGGLKLFWSADGSTDLGVASVAVGQVPGARLSVRVTLDVDNGSSGWTATFYTSTTPGTSGPWTMLGTPITVAGITSIFNSTTAVHVGDVATVGFGNLARKIFKAEVRSGIGGTIVANPDFTAQALGATSFADTAPSARTWTVTAGAVTNVYRRFTGQVSEYPPTWDTGGQDVTVPIVAASALDRYSRSRTVLSSTLRRRIASYFGPAGPNTLIAYWPCEDGADATTAMSPIPGVAPMTTSGVTFASDSTLPGSSPLPVLGTDSSTSEGAVPFAAPGQWDVELVYKIPAVPPSNSAFFYINSSTGTWRIAIDSTLIHVDVFDTTGTSVYSLAGITNLGFTGAWTHFNFQTQTSGSNTSYHMGWVVTGGGGFFWEDTVTGILPGRVTSVVQSHGGTLGQMSFGHIAVFNAYNLGNAAFSGADTGFNLERSTARVVRLAKEQVIPMSIVGAAGDGVQMGPQPIDTVINTLTDAVLAEETFLYEARDFAGLRFRNLNSIYAQPSMLDLPYRSGSGKQMIVAPFKPVGDLQNVVNDSTVTMANGTSARVQVTTGRLSVQEAPNGIGTGYAENIPENLGYASDTADHAGWRSFVGTFDADRYPSISLRLEKDLTRVPDVARLDVTHRLRVLAPLLSQMAPTTVDQMLLGYSEQLDQFSWLWTGACQPHGPYGSVLRYDDAVAKYDAPSCTLSAGMTTTATSASVVHAYDADRWADSATYPGDFPFSVVIAGEVCTCTAVTGTTAVQTMTLTRSVNGIIKAQVTGEPVHLAAPSVYGL